MSTLLTMTPNTYATWPIFRQKPLKSGHFGTFGDFGSSHADGSQRVFKVLLKMTYLTQK